MSHETSSTGEKNRSQSVPGGAYLSALLISLALISIVVLARPRLAPVAQTPTPTAAPTPSPVTVYITGEVRRPGTYTLPPGSRIEDAIRSAGGLTSRADTIAINLARRLQDEMQFNVPGRVSQARPVGDATKAPSESTVSTPRSAATTAPDDPSTQPSSPAVELTGPININTATAEELDALPGVGPSKAAAIVQYREEHGPFQRAEDLQEVSGIGPKLWETIKDLVTV